MTKSTVLKKYKNNLLAIIQESGLDPNLFIAEDKKFGNENYFTIRIRHPEILVLFAVRPYFNSFEKFCYLHSLFRADFKVCDTLYAENWETIVTKFKSWLDDIVKPYLDDIGTPDLWQTLGETVLHTKYESGTPEDFKSFSDEEKIKIRLSINDFRLLIVKNFNPNKEELAAINARLEYLSDAVDKHNKFDWKGIAINTVIAITIALSLNPDQGSQLFQFFKQVFSQLLYLLPSA